MLLVGLFSLVAVSEKVPHNQADGEPALVLSPASSEQPRIALPGLTLKQALHTKSFYVLTAAFSLGTLPFAVLLPQMIAHLTNEGLSLTFASLALSVLAAFGMTGKVVFGLLAERITARYAMMISFSGLAVASMIVGNPGSPIIMWMSVPLFGLCMGAFGALFMLVTQDNFGLRNFGSITGLMNMSNAVTFAVGPVAGGISFDATGSYHQAFIAVSVSMVVGAALLSQASPPLSSTAPGDSR